MFAYVNHDLSAVVLGMEEHQGARIAVVIPPYETVGLALRLADLAMQARKLEWEEGDFYEG